MSSFFSFMAGLGLGWNHIRLFQRMLEGLMQHSPDASFRRLATVVGLFRYVFTFLAGILLIRVARLEPFHLCGGLIFAVLVYRVYLCTRRDS
jgi:hypothetical protein